VSDALLFGTSDARFSDVKELSQRCVGGQELQQQRQKIQSLADETNILLKKNVYQNYMQFIETAKEISRIFFVLGTGRIISITM
jgi:hypothetical protein